MRGISENGAWPSNSARPVPMISCSRGSSAVRRLGRQCVIQASRILSLTLTPALIWQAIHGQIPSDTSLRQRPLLLGVAGAKAGLGSVLLPRNPAQLPEVRGLSRSIRRRRCRSCHIVRCLCVFARVIRIEQPT